MNEETDRGEETIGEMLKRLRGDTSLRAIQRLSGVSNAYLSQVEKGIRQPGPRLLRKLASSLRSGSPADVQEGRIP